MDCSMSIYRSSTGRRTLEEVYSDAVDQLGIEVNEQYVETRYGETHVLLAGPASGSLTSSMHLKSKLL
jgi:hypothetical protein